MGRPVSQKQSDQGTMSKREKRPGRTSDPLALCNTNGTIPPERQQNVWKTAAEIETIVVKRGLSQVEAGSLLLLMAAEFLDNLSKRRLHELLNQCVTDQ
jgi:hypothetical protein